MRARQRDFREEGPLLVLLEPYILEILPVFLLSTVKREEQEWEDELDRLVVGAVPTLYRDSAGLFR